MKDARLVMTFALLSALGCGGRVGGQGGAESDSGGIQEPSAPASAEGGAEGGWPCVPETPENAAEDPCMWEPWLPLPDLGAGGDQ
jgi:hypothetical protein